MEKLIYLISLWGLVSIQSILVTSEENLALKGLATQSSTHYTLVASKAIDGVGYGPDGGKICGTTGKESYPWWRLDLLYTYDVSTVIITARENCCLYQTRGAEIHIGNSPENNGAYNPICAVVPNIPEGASVIISCSGMRGRYINVVMPAFHHLTLCEVEVYRSENLALGGMATQSSTYFNWTAPKAIDGIRYAPDASTFCSSTTNESNPWWRLDLLGIYEIKTVVISNRGDGFTEQTNGAEIRVGISLENNGNNNPICAVISDLQVRSNAKYSCNGMVGRFVNVVVPAAQSLSLCEVEIYGTAIPLRKTFLGLKLSYANDIAAVRNKILQQLHSDLALHITDFKLSWTQLPKKEIKQEVKKMGSCLYKP